MDERTTNRTDRVDPVSVIVAAVNWFGVQKIDFNMTGYLTNDQQREQWRKEFSMMAKCDGNAITGEQLSASLIRHCCQVAQPFPSSRDQ